MTVWFVFLLLAVIACLVTVAVLLPNFLLRKAQFNGGSLDSGIKYVREENGESILYRPLAKYAKYVEQYILSSRGGKKVFIAKLAQPIDFMDYTLKLFDNTDKFIGNLRVNEVLKRRETTREIELPSETAYIAFTLTKVNQEVLGSDKEMQVSLKQILIYLVLATAFALLGVLVINFCIVYSYGGMFTESFLNSIGGIVSIIFETLLVAGVNCAAAVFQVKYNFGKKIKNG